MGILELLIVLIITAGWVWVWGRIFRKAGYSFWLGLIMIVPLAVPVLVIVLALSKWPIEGEIERYRMQLGYSGGGFEVMQPVQPAQTIVTPPQV